MRVIVTGSRTWRNRMLLYAELTKLTAELAPGERLTVVVGYDPEKKLPKGADEMAYEWTQLIWCADAECHPALWEEYGKPAGFIRNQEMIDSGADKALAFNRNHSRGTKDCAERAEKAGIHVERFEDND